MTRPADEREEGAPLDLSQFEGHTPGPWYSWIPRNTGGCRTIRTQRGRGHGGYHGTEIATTHGLADDIEDGANAALMAAGPDLLAEVKALRSPTISLTDQQIGEAFDAANAGHRDHAGVLFYEWAKMPEQTRPFWRDYARRIADAIAARSAAPAGSEGTPPQFVTDELVVRAMEAFYPNWHTYSPSYRAGKHKRWAKALRAVLLPEPPSPVVRYPQTEFIDGKLTVTGWHTPTPEQHAENERRIAEVDAGFYWTLLDGWMVPSKKLFERDGERAYLFAEIAASRSTPAATSEPEPGT